MGKLVLFPNCFPVRGSKRSLICDVSRYKYDFIPHSLYELLIKYNRKELSEIESELSPPDLTVFRSYLQFLIDKDYIFFTDDIDLFPEIELSWDHPSPITNAIIDFDENSEHDLGKIIAELNDLGCEALELRSFAALAPEKLWSMTDHLQHSGFRSVQLLLRYHPDYTRDLLKKIVSKHPRIMSVVVHSTPENAMDNEESTGRLNIFFVRNDISSESHCGAIAKFNFAANISLFMESHFHNNCLNRKISIDKNGNIKNCPSMATCYGHHITTSLQDALGQPAFKKHWNISKDEVDVCKDCEFRYICTDCRVYTVDSANAYAKPAKCSYDPYTATWAAD